MDKLVSLAKRRGFVFQSSEIYGGLGSVWDYGPLGVELKKNIKERWWRSMVHEREDVEGLDAAILMHPKAKGGIGTRGGILRSPWSIASSARIASGPMTPASRVRPGLPRRSAPCAATRARSPLRGNST